MLNVPSQSFPSPSSQQRVATGERSKVPLKPGRSLMDWVRLTKSNKDLTGLKGRLIDVTAEELAKHNTKEDCWTCIRGLVYNVSPYMEYHPGGEDELMKAAGIDGTDLFNQVHRWVNYESMLKECLVGRMIVKLSAVLKENPAKRTEAKQSFNGVAGSEKLLEAVARDFPPRYDWFQTDSAVTLAIYTKLKDLESEMATVDIEGRVLRAEIIVRNYSYLLHLLLNHTVEEEVEVNVTGNVGKLEIVLKKQEILSWAKLGQPLDGHDSFIKHKDRALFYRKCKLVSKADVNYNTKLFCLLPSNGTFLQVPVGHHVYLKQTIADIEMVKPYTPVSSALRWSSQESLSTDSRGIFLMIKIYPNGEFTQPLDNLQIGDELYVSGPQGSFKKSQVQNIEELCLLAAGTGLTPMIKLLNYVLTDVPSLRKVTLMFFNKKENDILWRSQLEEVVLHDARFDVHFVLSQAADEWIGLKGTISLALLSKVVRFKENSNSLICICGPSMFTSQGIGFLEALGFSKEQVYGFTE